MALWAKCTRVDGEPIYINLDHIVTMVRVESDPAHGAHTFLRPVAGKAEFLRVKDTPDEIIAAAEE